jgi:glycosyltransferase involved in cell wall biosynthesis
MEALLFGVSPVIMDNELGHELFGDYAFYAKNSDADGIAESIRHALTETDKIGKIKNSGPEFIKKYNWRNFAERFFQNIKN